MCLALCLLLVKISHALPAPQGSPWIMLSHLLLGMDPSGPPKLIDDLQITDDSTMEDFLDDEDSPFLSD